MGDGERFSLLALAIVSLFLFFIVHACAKNKIPLCNLTFSLSYFFALILAYTPFCSLSLACATAAAAAV